MSSSQTITGKCKISLNGGRGASALPDRKNRIKQNFTKNYDGNHFLTDSNQTKPYEKLQWESLSDRLISNKTLRKITMGITVEISILLSFYSINRSNPYSVSVKNMK